MGLALAANPVVTAIGVTLLVLAGAAAVRARSALPLVAVALVLMWAALPVAIPRSVIVSNRTVSLAEPLMIVTGALAAIGMRPRFASWTPVAYLGALAMAAVGGVLNGADISTVIRELQGVAGFLGAFVLFASLQGAGLLHVGVWMVGAVLNVSALFYLLSLGAGVRLSGRTESVHLGTVVTHGSTRLITPATHLSVAALCAVVAVLAPASDRRRWPVLLGVAAPALLIMFFGFSRSSLLALVAATAFVVLEAREPRRALQVLRRAGSLTLVVVAVAAVGFALDVPGSGYAARQVGAYRARVVAGISEASLRQEHVRLLENRYAQRAFSEHPVIGRGIGVPYRPVLSARFETFTTGVGTTYIHNGYWWLLVKGGLVYLVAFGSMVAVALGRLARRPREERPALHVAAAAALVGFLAANIVVPVVSDQGAAPVLGALLGVLLSAAPPRDDDELAGEGAALAVASR